MTLAWSTKVYVPLVTVSGSGNVCHTSWDNQRSCQDFYLRAIEGTVLYSHSHSFLHSHKFGADSHSKHFCCCKEGSYLGMKLAQRLEDKWGERETEVSEYCTTLIFSSHVT